MELYGYTQRKSMEKFQENLAKTNYRKLNNNLPKFIIHYDFNHIIKINVGDKSYICKLKNIDLVREKLAIYYIIAYFNDRIWPQMRNLHNNKKECFHYFICVTLKNNESWDWIKWNTNFDKISIHL